MRDHPYCFSGETRPPVHWAGQKDKRGWETRVCPAQRASLPLASEEASEVRGERGTLSCSAPRAPRAPWPGGLLHDPEANSPRSLPALLQAPMGPNSSMKGTAGSSWARSASGPGGRSLRPAVWTPGPRPRGRPTLRDADATEPARACVTAFVLLPRNNRLASPQPWTPH